MRTRKAPVIAMLIVVGAIILLVGWSQLSPGHKQAVCWTKADAYFSGQKSQLLNGNLTAAEVNRQWCVEAETQFSTCLSDSGIGGSAATSAKENYDIHRNHCAAAQQIGPNNPTVAF